VPLGNPAPLKLCPELTSSPPWKGFPSKAFIFPLIGSGLHPWWAVGGARTPHLKRGLSSSPCKRSEEVGCPCSPISLVELGRSVVIISKNRLDEGVFKEGLSIPLEAFRPLNPQFL